MSEVGVNLRSIQWFNNGLVTSSWPLSSLLSWLLLNVDDDNDVVDDDDEDDIYVYMCVSQDCSSAQ